MAKKIRIQDKALLKSVKSERCVICGKDSDPCHIKSRGSGGDDVPENLIPMCRNHHGTQHSIGWSRFIELYPRVEEVLNSKGWKLEQIFGRNRLVRK